MPKRSRKSDSDPPSAEFKPIEILEEGIEIQHTKAYGVGIDCHSRFIQVSVIVKCRLHTYEYRFESGTDLPSLAAAREKSIDIICSKSDPPVSISQNVLHYCIESTSSYHLPVLSVWKGIPSVVNPMLAGATKRKTDVLDARLLAIHDLTGIWSSFYVASSDIQQLRMLIEQKLNYQKTAVCISNRINNNLLKLGYTFGQGGSVMNSEEIRCILEDELSDHPNPDAPYRPEGAMPESVRCLFRNDLDDLDECRQQVSKYLGLAIGKAKSMDWETQNGILSGDEMIRILTTAPGIGELTAVVWLSIIITPRRFPNSRAISAYCGLDPSLKISARKVTSTKKRGGNKQLHSSLNRAASVLMGKHSEPFGQWAYNIYNQTGRWKKGTNALARRLCVAMYYMQMNGAEFSYDKYTLAVEPQVIDIPVLLLSQINPDFKRYVAPLASVNIRTTSEMVRAYSHCELKNVRGIGKKFFGIIREFISNQGFYIKELESLKGGTVNDVTQ